MVRKTLIILQNTKLNMKEPFKRTRTVLSYGTFGTPYGTAVLELFRTDGLRTGSVRTVDDIITGLGQFKHTLDVFLSTFLSLSPLPSSSLSLS